MDLSTPSLTAPHRASAQLLVLAIVVCAGIFYFTKHDSRMSLREYTSYSMDETETLLQTGHWQRPLGFSLFAAFGTYCLLRKGGRFPQFSSPLAISVLLVVAWCAASIAWADDPDLTIKRVGVMLLSLVGAAGLASQFSARQICILTIIVLATYCTIGLVVELALHTFLPWRSGYQFAGTVHPNLQAVHCAILCLATASLLTDRTTQNRLPYAALLALAMVLLLLTRSRTGIASLIPALGVALIPRVPKRFRLLTGVGLAWLFVMFLLLGTIADAPVAQRMTNAVLMGRSGSTSTLQGRLPLWATLMDYVWQRPLIGHGFDSFWNVSRIRSVSRFIDWSPSSAHSIYIETTLSIGLIGATLLLLTMAQSIYQLGRQYFKTSDGGMAFLFGLLVYGAFDGLLESLFVEPTFITVIAATGVMHMAFSQKEPQQS